MSGGRTPFGNNNLSAKRIFEERKYYKETSYPEDIDGINPVDFWYNVTGIRHLQPQLYGRLNHKADAIYPSEAILKQIPSSAGTVLAINYVADAFISLTRYIQKQKLENAAAAPGFLGSIEAKKGWASVNALYHNYIQQVYEALAEGTLANNKKKIRNFDDFTKFVKQYSDDLREEGIPITKTGFIKSSLCPVTVSGLCVEIADFDHSTDPEKVDDFINGNPDGCFECYVKYADSYGFKVDKNAPWRLVADLSSPRMQYFMNNYGITVDNVFEKYFYSAHRLDFENIKFYMRQFYNSYVAVNPTETLPMVFPGLRTKNYVFTRQQMNPDRYNDLYGEKYVLDLCKHFRMNEARVECNKKMCERVDQHLRRLYNHVDKNAVLDYINNMTKPQQFQTAISYTPGTGGTLNILTATAAASATGTTVGAGSGTGTTMTLAGGNVASTAGTAGAGGTTAGTVDPPPLGAPAGSIASFNLSLLI